MPISRIAALVRSLSTYRVEACFLAALVFTLARQADHREHRVEVRAARTAHTVVHEITPVRVAPAFAPHQIVERTGAVGIAVPAPRVHVVTTSPNKRLVFRSDSAAAIPCPVAVKVGSAAQGASCKFISVAPPAEATALAKAFVDGG